jgi:hypothetical protein
MDIIMFESKFKEHANLEAGEFERDPRLVDAVTQPRFLQTLFKILTQYLQVDVPRPERCKLAIDQYFEDSKPLVLVAFEGWWSRHVIIVPGSKWSLTGLFNKFVEFNPSANRLSNQTKNLIKNTFVATYVNENKGRGVSWTVVKNHPVLIHGIRYDSGEKPSKR